MSESAPLTILCLASYEKGAEFMRESKRQGCRVFLITTQELADRDWPRESLDDIFYLPDMYNRQDVVNAVSYLARSQEIDRIVALDDFDVEIAASLREHLRVPGMGDTTARYFRDKLAMRVKAQENGVRVPVFVPVFNHDQVRHFLATVPAPWLLKPRMEATLRTRVMSAAWAPPRVEAAPPHPAPGALGAAYRELERLVGDPARWLDATPARRSS